MTKGIIIFAENNEEIDYVKFATINAYMIREYMNVPVSLITNKESAPTGAHPFDNVIIHEKSKEQTKLFVGYGAHGTFAWYNSNRVLAYKLSPYDETILIDADYLIMSDVLNQCWGREDGLLMSNEATDLLFNKINLKERRLFDTSISMYWATVVYFNRSEKAKLFFDLVESVAKNWEYYTALFNVRVGLYRNDYAFSIAAHLLGGCTRDYINPTPDHVLLTSFHADKILTVNKGRIDLVAQEGVPHYPVRVTTNVHYMNKFDLMEQSDRFLEIYGDCNGN